MTNRGESPTPDAPPQPAAAGVFRDVVDRLCAAQHDDLSRCPSDARQQLPSRDAVIGIVEALSSTYISLDLAQLFTFLIFLAVLFIRPSGLFGGATK